MLSDRCLTCLSCSVCLSVTLTYCQTARWIKMKLGSEVGLGPGHIVLDCYIGNHLPPPPQEKGGTAAPHFSAHVYCGQTGGWIKMLLGTQVGLRPGDIMLDKDPTPPREETPNFRPTSVVAKRLGRSKCHLVRR